MDLYETYIRTKRGDTYHPEDIRSAFRDFLGENGYRISFNIEGVEITLRRDSQVDADQVRLDEQIDAKSIDCMVTLRGLTPFGQV